MFQARVDTPTIGLTEEQRRKFLLEALEKALRDKDEPRSMELIRKLRPLTKPPETDAPTTGPMDEEQKVALLEALEKALQAKDEAKVIELIRALPPLAEPFKK
jgi:uncharacterized protein YpiB (UPF0302 family)